MKTRFFRYFYTILIIGLLYHPAQASISKMYIGTEDGQAIIGIESLNSSRGGAIGGEIRTFFSKKGIIVNGIEYGRLPTKIQLSLTIGGENKLNALKLKNTIAYIHSVPIKFTRNSEIKVSSGAGPYIMYE